MRPSAVLFDLDGTLVDSRGDIAAACNHALAQQGRAALSVDVISRFVGDGARMLVARAFALAPDDPLVERGVADFRAYYEAHPTDYTTLLPGALALLEVLARAEARIGLVTNKPRDAAALVLDQLQIARFFSTLRAGGDGPLKPDPWPVVDALRELAVPPSRAWFVGDGPQDVGAGRAAGCFTIAVRAGFASDEALASARPDRVVDSLAVLAAELG